MEILFLGFAYYGNAAASVLFPVLSMSSTKKFKERRIKLLSL